VHLSPADVFLKYAGGAHTHIAVPERIEVRKLMTNVKKRVTKETMAIGQIYNEELANTNLSKAALAIAPTAKEASKSKLLPLT